MNLIAYDYFKRLEQVGFSQEQATVLVALATEASNEMANKQELNLLEKDIKQEIILSESKVENVIKELKIELLKEIQTFRKEVNEEIQAFRKEVNEEIQAFRKEMYVEFQSFRNELNIENKSLNSRMDKLEGEIKFIRGLCVFIAGVISTASLLFGMIKFFL